MGNKTKHINIEKTKTKKKKTTATRTTKEQKKKKERRKNSECTEALGCPHSALHSSYAAGMRAACWYLFHIPLAGDPDHGQPRPRPPNAVMVRVTGR